MFQDSEITLREKNFSDFQTNLSPGIAMRLQRQKLPFTCNQRRQTLPVRIAWAGGVVVSFSAFYAGGRGFDSHIHQS